MYHQNSQEHCAEFEGVKPLYIGGSFGGYVGMELLGRGTPPLPSPTTNPNLLPLPSPRSKNLIPKYNHNVCRELP